jgi:hypothetical protein
MDQATAQTVREIEQTRERLGTHLQELEERLPAGTTVRKVAGFALGGGAGTTIFWFAVRRMRARRAAAAAKAPVRMVVNMLPDDVAKSMRKAIDDGEWKGWVAGIGTAWVLFRLAELRQLRKMRTAMIAR